MTGLLRNAKGFIDENGRVCLDCSEYKEKSNFPKATKLPYEMFSYCKPCVTIRNKVKYEKAKLAGTPYVKIINDAKEWRRKFRKEIIEHYGAKCACLGCNVDTYEFLTIDHVNNDGAKHRKEVGRGGYMLQDIKRRGYPDDFQILCYNCNGAKGAYGKCPGHF